MWQRIQSLFKRINKDPVLEELLERNKKALEKQRREAELPSSAQKNSTQTDRQ